MCHSLLGAILRNASKLEEADKIPQIFCEPTDLIKLPPIAADPISDLVLGNKACLQEIEVRSLNYMLRLLLFRNPHLRLKPIFQLPHLPPCLMPML